MKKYIDIYVHTGILVSPAPSRRIFCVSVYALGCFQVYFLLGLTSSQQKRRCSVQKCVASVKNVSGIQAQYTPVVFNNSQYSAERGSRFKNIVISEMNSSKVDRTNGKTMMVYQFCKILSSLIKLN